MLLPKHLFQRHHGPSHHRCYFYSCVVLLLFLVVYIAQRSTYVLMQSQEKLVAPTTIKERSLSSDILLLNQRVGSISRICDFSMNLENIDQLCTLRIPPCEEANGGKTCSNTNGPMPIRVRNWMSHPVFREQSILLFLSSHVPRSSGDDIQVLGRKSSSNTWTILNVTLSFPVDYRCRSFHSPSIVVDDEEKRFYMYVHGHNCKGKDIFQPTLLFVSDDGVSWLFFQDQPTYLLSDLFYLSVPVHVKQDGYYYAIAKTQENSIGSAILCRSKSLIGPFEKGPILARGLRHVDVHIYDSFVYVFFTMIGDAPERILLGSIDISSGSNFWMDWTFLPGPIILEPEFYYEHGNATITPSESGPAEGILNQVRDPRFLPDNDDESTFCGTLFYSVQGEQGIAMARLEINQDDYQRSVSYRNHSNIQRDVMEAASLKRSKKPQNETVLITGVGRSGTTYLCTLLQATGIRVSHDNDIDCGPYPGPDGAVSWYDAFDIGKHFDHVLHIVRDPLKVIDSRVFKARKDPSHVTFLINMTKRYEESSDLSYGGRIKTNQQLYRFILKHWVRRNSFVEYHASWREKIENVKSQPLAAWQLCMASHFGCRCPDLFAFRRAIDSVMPNLNSMYRGATLSKMHLQMQISSYNNERKIRQNDVHSTSSTWASLAEVVGPENQDYVWIAKEMARRYGYVVPAEQERTRVGYACGFKTNNNNTAPAKLWDCWQK